MPAKIAMETTVNRMRAMALLRFMAMVGWRVIFVELWAMTVVSKESMVRKVEQRNAVEIKACIRSGSYDVLVCGGMCTRRR
jgi:hypothetical protein